jgi:hypothetical protein
MGRAIGLVVGYKAYIKAESLWNGRKTVAGHDPDERPHSEHQGWKFKLAAVRKTGMQKLPSGDGARLT